MKKTLLIVGNMALLLVVYGVVLSAIENHLLDTSLDCIDTTGPDAMSYIYESCGTEDIKSLPEDMYQECRAAAFADGEFERRLEASKEEKEVCSMDLRRFYGNSIINFSFIFIDFVRDFPASLDDVPVIGDITLYLFY